VNKDFSIPVVARLCLMAFMAMGPLHAETPGFLKDKLLETRLHYGFLWPHHSSIAYSVTGHVPALEINLLEQTHGKNYWDALFHFPRIGFGMSCYYLQDHKVYGSSLGLYGIFDNHMYRSNKWALSYRIYGGLSWLTRVWDLEKNPALTAIGSHINLFFRASATARFTLGPRSELLYDLGLTHFSNGNIKEPNLGLNIVTATLGYVHHFNAQQPGPIPAPTAPPLTDGN
jgi:hypothetical protein